MRPIQFIAILIGAYCAIITIAEVVEGFPDHRLNGFSSHVLRSQQMPPYAQQVAQQVYRFARNYQLHQDDLLFISEAKLLAHRNWLQSQCTDYRVITTFGAVSIGQAHTGRWTFTPKAPDWRPIKVVFDF